MSRSRTALAFLCAGVTVLVGILISGAVQSLVHGDRNYLAAALLVPVFGGPFVLAALLLAWLIYRLARRADRVSLAMAVGTGAAVGAVSALVARMPLLPPWAATLVGAAAGWIWWQVRGAPRSASRAT